jgi:hypothetical protein
MSQRNGRGGKWRDGDVRWNKERGKETRKGVKKDHEAGKKGSDSEVGDGETDR